MTVRTPGAGLPGHFFAEECGEEPAALGHRTCWDGYFASRAAPLGRVPAQVVHAAFYRFADGEAAWHTPTRGRRPA